MAMRYMDTSVEESFVEQDSSLEESQLTEIMIRRSNVQAKMKVSGREEAAYAPPVFGELGNSMSLFGMLRSSQVTSGSVDHRPKYV